MRERVAEDDPRFEDTKEELIAAKERIYADFHLLRTRAMGALSIENWKAFLDRRWHQFAKEGFTMTPPAPSLWGEYWKNRGVAKNVNFHTSLLIYTLSAANTMKQKLRNLATQALEMDTVL
jgi:hypothetical protein